MTTTTLIHGITAEVFNMSAELAENVFSKSSTLTSNHDVSDFVPRFYNQRRPFISELVGTEGRFSFTPKSFYDATEEANKQINTELEILEKAYNLTPLNSKEGKEIETKYKVLSLLRNRLTNEDYLANKVTDSIMEKSAEHTEDCKPFMTSPKLSRWITKLVGESSDFTKWYTNSCPKGENVVGERSDFKLTLSVLPHDIAGMSYYAPLNFGGERWIDGYSGTSCMDTLRNGDGGSMRQLPLNLMDETMMVAYLTKVDTERSEDLHELEDEFHVRMLVRVVEVKGKHILIGQRIYGTTRGSVKLITEAMKVQFGDSYIHCLELDDMTGGRTSFVYKHVGQKDVNVEDCPSCDGSGNDSWGDDCGRCEGTGRYGDLDTPYNDNPSVVEFEMESVRFKLPKKFVESI